MNTRRLIVVGGGPAGLMAAGQAAGLGVKTLVLEKMDRPGRKLRITGKGRCNLTNAASLEDFLAHYGDNGRFLRQAFARFFSQDLTAFIGGLGITVKTERGGRVFTEEGAPELAVRLTEWAGRQGVSVRTGSRVTAIHHIDRAVTGVRILSSDGDAEDSEAACVILAAGGASYPATGSAGDGYRLAKALGHDIVSPGPALVPVETEGNTAVRLQGLSLRNVVLKVLCDGRVQAEAFGEMLFTHFGVSGPIVLSLSKVIGRCLKKKDSVILSIDLKPALDENRLDERLRRELDLHGKRSLQNMLKTLLPSALIPVCLDALRLDPHKPGHQITAEERTRLRAWLKNMELKVLRTRPMAEAIVTAGGISLHQVDPRTMASRVVSGLYFAGEVLDLDGDTGGFNLQAAFSTGWLAGRSAARWLTDQVKG
ncbi:MAG TPA: NAD(P)/FAD-dependent oxidoreductase [bacterium]|nr:NAD(P)/FAD-dependent oxidoreductase [bacterium]